MSSPFTVEHQNLTLDRFPLGQMNRSLQAWDAADEYIVKHISKENLVNASTRVLVFNDLFGALSTNLTHSTVFCVNDSWVSQSGIKHNLTKNNLDESKVTLLSSLDTLPTDIDVILYKIPKTKALLIHQLIQITHTYGNKSDIKFIAADRAKDIHTSTLKLFEKYCGPTRTSLAVKKARLVFSELNQQSIQQSPYPTEWVLENTEYLISNHANVYAREKLDIGARYFIKNLPEIHKNSNVIDLGCGNGVIGLSLLTKQPMAHITFIDESYMAIASAQKNVTHNLAEAAKLCAFNVNDCLSNIESNSVDLILCNPPFHQGQATTDHIAWQMFKDSYRVLKKGGELRIIGNRQLGYHIKLKRLFGNEKLIASNEKFVTLSAIK